MRPRRGASKSTSARVGHAARGPSRSGRAFWRLSSTPRSGICPRCPNRRTGYRGFSARIDAEAGQRERWRGVSRLFRRSGALRLGNAAKAVAAGLLIVLLITQPRSITASELLARAEEAQRSVPDPHPQTKRVATQRLRVENRTRAVEVELSWPLDGPHESVWTVSADPSRWTSPLTAGGVRAMAPSVGRR